MNILNFSFQKKENQTFGPPYAVLNLSKIGLRYFRICINASNESKEHLASVFSKHPNVGWIFYCEGYFNFAIGLWARDNAEINDISQQVRNLLSSQDEIVLQSELTSLYSFGSELNLGNRKGVPIVDATINPVTLSPLEIDYIKLLALDSSLRQEELAKILNIEESQLRDLTKHLTNSGVIVGYQERIEYGGMYVKVFIDTLSRKTKDAEQELIKRLWDDAKCIYLERANNKYDFEFELILDKKSEITNYVKNFSDYKLVTLTKNIYTNLYPLGKIANLKEIKDTLLSQSGKVINLKNSKLWYLNYAGAEAYLDIYTGNKEYFLTMEKSELDLFNEVTDFIKQNYQNETFSVIDIGSGNGMKGREFIEKLGDEVVKAYYPVDIQPIELATTLAVHHEGLYAKHPTLLDIENLSSRFPLNSLPQKKQIYIILGGTYGNFKQTLINAYLKSVVGGSSILLVAMPIVSHGKTDQEIINSYTGKTFDDMICGPLLQVGFQKSNFEKNENAEGTLSHFDFEDRRLVSSLILKEPITIFDTVFEKGTQFQLTTSWKPTLDEFKTALEKDFVIDKIFSNNDMAIAVITKTL